MLLDALKTAALETAGDSIVIDVRIGLGYTAVMLDSGSVGLAYTFRDRAAAAGCSVFQGTRPLVGSYARHMLEYLTSAESIERTLGLATANALFNTARAAGSMPEWHSLEGDLLDVLELTKDDRVGMVGYFGPLVPVIKKHAGELIVFEENTARAEGLLPGSRAGEILPSCSVVIITATSIINESFERIAVAGSKSRIKVLLGPSTPLAPKVFSTYGVTHLSGTIAVDPEEILRVVSEGGGTRFFMKWSKKINLVCTR